ncbi:MAG TPA: hypothetical protein VM487_05025 [Phycisphaerae bacterium]|nr:hypothetical protein [Phycisphaerae bacterium]
MMEWTDVSPEARATMTGLGHFSPTVDAADKSVKGYVEGKVYWTSTDLREMSAHMVEVADWLDQRAQAAKETT